MLNSLISFLYTNAHRQILGGAMPLYIPSKLELITQVLLHVNEIVIAAFHVKCFKCVHFMPPSASLMRLAPQNFSLDPYMYANAHAFTVDLKDG